MLPDGFGKSSAFGDICLLALLLAKRKDSYGLSPNQEVFPKAIYFKSVKLSTIYFCYLSQPSITLKTPMFMADEMAALFRSTLTLRLLQVLFFLFFIESSQFHRCAYKSTDTYEHDVKCQDQEARVDGCIYEAP